MRARVIRREAGAGERWSAPALDARCAAKAPGDGGFIASMLERDDTADAMALAREQGFAQGHAQGLAAAHEQSQAQLQTLAALTANLREPLARVDDQVVDELCRLALAVARQVIRRELATDPRQVAAVIEEARRALGEVRGELCLALHPDEAAVMRELLSADQALCGIRVDADPAIARGGCTVRSDVSFVDATVETRIARVAVQLLGDERVHGAAPDAEAAA